MPWQQSSIGDLLHGRAHHLTQLAAAFRATVVFDSGPGKAWTLHIDFGRAWVTPGRAPHPDTIVVADEEMLAGVVSGTHSGIDAFLEGRLSIRGNLALALKLDSMFLKPPRPVDHPRAGYVQAGKIRTFYLEAGAGAPAILLHGLGATNASMLPTLRVLSGRYRVIAPDNPGFGDSAKPVAPYHAAFFAHWLKDFMNAMGIEKTVLIGNSMGGRIAIETALRYPDRVTKMVLYAPSMAFQRMRQFVPIVKVLRPELALLPMFVPRRQVRATLLALFSKPQRIPPVWYEAAIDEFLRVFANPFGRVAFFSAARQIYLEDPRGKRGFWDRLPQVRQPALFLWGKRDILVPPAFARHVTQALPHAESITLDDCGHVPQFELPDTTHRLTHDFLRATQP